MTRGAGSKKAQSPLKDTAHCTHSQVFSLLGISAEIEFLRKNPIFGQERDFEEMGLIPAAPPANRGWKGWERVGSGGASPVRVRSNGGQFPEPTTSAATMSSIPLRPTGTTAARTIVRGLMARHCVGNSDEESLLAFARQAWPREDEHAITKAAVGALANDGTWDRYAADFLQDVRQRSVLGRMGFRRLPFYVRMLKATQGAQGFWVSQSKPIPLSKPAIVGSRLQALHAAGIICLTKECLQNTSPLVEAALQEDLTAAVAGIIDQALLDPSNAGVADEMPASITYDAPSVASVGAFGEQALRDDLEALFALYEGDPETAALAMSPRTALQICLMSARLGNTDLTTTGGTLFGLPVATSSAMSGGSAGDTIALIDRRGIAYGLENFDIVQSMQTSLLMSDDPPDGPAELVSMFQTGTVAFKATAGANWENQREGGVVLLTGVDYSGEGS